MKIALIYMELDFWALGPRTISAVLKSAGYDTRLLLMGTEEKTFSQEALLEARKLTMDADLIGVSSFSRGSEKAKELILALKPLNKLVVWGGVHATLYLEECAAAADLVCRGEGEHFMLELTERIERGQNWKDIANGAYFSDGKLVINELRPLIDDLDTLPLPDYSRTDEFLLDKHGFKRVDSPPGPEVPIMFTGSRGCAFQCSYCSNAKLKKLFSDAGRYVRRMSVGKFVEQASALKKLHPESRRFYLVDEDFMARSAEELREFSVEFPRKVGLPFECMASPAMVTEEKMELLTKAGLSQLDLGVESGSDRTKREIYNRPVSNEIIMRAARIVNKFSDVLVYYFLIIGNPYEEKDDLIETIRFISNLPTPFYLRTYNLVFLPGSLLYDTAVEDGIIEGKHDSGFELDFLGGFNYLGHAWKEKELYLNGLLSLMSGKNTRWRAGLLPRVLLRAATMGKLVKINMSYRKPIKALIRAHMKAIQFRRRAGVQIRQIQNSSRRLYALRKQPI
jgi:anaerobic magnesium-protoporphyrin IX monomethyl ester cyclase